MMLPYSVEFSPRANEEFRQLPKHQQKKIAKLVDRLEANPRPAGVEKLKEAPSFWRIRSGKVYRVIYAIFDDERKIIVVVVRHRKDAYRNLESLDLNKLLAMVKSDHHQHQSPSAKQ